MHLNNSNIFINYFIFLDLMLPILDILVSEVKIKVICSEQRGLIWGLCLVLLGLFSF